MNMKANPSQNNNSAFENQLQKIHDRATTFVLYQIDLQLNKLNGNLNLEENLLVTGNKNSHKKCPSVANTPNLQGDVGLLPSKKRPFTQPVTSTNSTTHQNIRTEIINNRSYTQGTSSIRLDYAKCCGGPGLTSPISTDSRSTNYPQPTRHPQVNQQSSIYPLTTYPQRRHSYQSNGGNNPKPNNARNNFESAKPSTKSPSVVQTVKINDAIDRNHFLSQHRNVIDLK